MSAFVIKVKTDNAGTSASDQFTLPGNSSYSYNFDVDWGDGSPVETINTGSSWTHTFTGGAGTYSVSITENVAGGFPAIYFNNGGDKAKLLEIEQWGTNRWDTLSRSFYGCSNLTITASDHATADTGNVTSFLRAWEGCSSLASFPLIDTSSGTDFFAAWAYCAFTSFPLIDASSGSDFRYSWYQCTSLTSFPAIDMSSGGSFSNTWEGCTSLTSFPVIDMSSATTLRYAWSGCGSLASFGEVVLSICTDFVGTWRNCSSLTSFPIINTSSGANFTSTWEGCSSLTAFPLIDLANGATFANTWRNCSSLTSFPALNFEKLSVGGSAFSGVTLSTASYDAMLANSFANNVNNNVTFNGGNSKYAESGKAVRDVLTAAIRSWTITDGGFDATYVYPVESTVVPQLLRRRRMSGGLVI